MLPVVSTTKATSSFAGGTPIFSCPTRGIAAIKLLEDTYMHSRLFEGLKRIDACETDEHERS
jgi:hypothetical protein